MRATSVPNRRQVVVAVVAALLLGACGRGVPEQQVASEGSERAAPTEASPSVEQTAPTSAPQSSTTSAAEPMPTASSTAPPESTTSTTARPPSGDLCARPTVRDYPLSPAGGKPTALAVAADGAVWFTDNGHAAIGRLAPDGTVRMFPLTLNRQPAGIAVGPGGGVWFTQYAWDIAGRPSTPSDRPVPPPDPATIGPPAIGRIGPDGTVMEFPLPTMAGNRMGDPMSGALPRGIVAGPDGALWFTESGADQIGRIAPDGTITEYPLPSRDRVHAFPDDIIVGPDGALWFTETLSGAIGRIDPTTRAITEFPTNSPGTGGPGTQGTGARHLAAGSDGALWFGNWDTALGRMTTSGKTKFFPIGPKAQLLNALITGPDGRLWFADDRSAAIFRVARNGTVSQLVAIPGIPAKDWEALGGLAAGSDGSIWVATPSSNRIVRISCGV